MYREFDGKKERCMYSEREDVCVRERERRRERLARKEASIHGRNVTWRCMYSEREDVCVREREKEREISAERSKYPWKKCNLALIP